MTARSVVLAVTVGIGTLGVLLFSFSTTISKEAATEEAWLVLKGSLERKGVRSEAFDFVEMVGDPKNGWLLTWKSKHSDAYVKVAISASDLNVSGMPIFPDCDGVRLGTVVNFGPVCR